MKTKFLLATLLFAVFSMITVNANAQQKLTEVTKKLETMDNVDVNIVQQRDKQTRKIGKVIKNYTVNTKALVDEILNAFAQDKKDALTMIDNKQAGRVIPSFYKFEEGGKEISYSLSVFNDGQGATLTVIDKAEE